jgi:cation:H+ antiporter
MIYAFLILVLGLILVVKGADWLVEGAASLARKFNVSDLAIGLTIVAFGTSAPELVVNGYASYEGHSAMVFGNVIGSNIFNLFMILGVAGLIIPLTVQSSTVWKEIPFALFSIVLVWLLTSSFLSDSRILSRVDGILLLSLFAGFLFYVFTQLKSDPTQLEIQQGHTSNYKIALKIIGGLAGLVIGGKLVLENAVSIARSFEVSERIIGLTIVAAGTSLPELATSVVAAYRKKSDIAVGNIIGSNIFNFLLIFGVSSVIRPISYDPVFDFDLLMISVGTVLLFIAMFTGKKKKLDRWEAAILLGTFIVYTFYLIYEK